MPLSVPEPHFKRLWRGLSTDVHAEGVKVILDIQLVRAGC